MLSKQWEITVAALGTTGVGAHSQGGAGSSTMRRGSVLRSATVLAGGLLGLSVAAGGARAQQITGIYIGAGAGYSILQNQAPTVDAVVSYAPSSHVTTTSNYDGGFGVVGSIGYGVGNGVRLEVEGSYRDNQQTRDTAPGSPVGRESKYGVMGNVLYDIDLGANWIYPYVGAGFGFQFADWKIATVDAANLSFQTTASPVTVDQTVGKIAYQAIIGVAFPIEFVPGLSLTAEYRYMALSGQRNYLGTATFAYSPPATTRVHVADDSNHTLLVGLRYAFDSGPPEAPPPALAPAPAPAFAPPSATRTYLVFFDWDRSDLTPRARDIVAEAVRASARTPHTRIEVSGNADRSGTPQYNLTLSQARAEAVANEMSRWGVPRSIMDIHAYGDTRPLVPTAAGVREPQNRRVEIVYR